MNKITGKVSNLIIAFFIGAIIISFALTGFSGFNNTANSVGNVDGNPITIAEYNNAFNIQLQRYTQIFKKDLTAQQIRQFKVKENALNELINKKVMVNYALELNLNTANDEIKESIKELPYFKSNDKFDVNKYKSLLTANNLTPAKFEETFKEDLSLQKLVPLFEDVYVSKSYAKDIITFKNNGPEVIAVRFEKEKNTKFINVTKNEISNFISKKENESVLKSVYNGMKSEFVKPDELKASHILLKTLPDGSNNKEIKVKAEKLRKKLSRSNFASIAKKESEDTGSAAKGGDLGYFSKGRMVPEFEKAAFSLKNGQISQPIKSQYGYHIIYRKDFKKGINKKLEDVKDIVAKRHLQKTKRKELKEINDKLKDQITAALSTKNTKRLKKLSEEFEFTLITDKNLNFYDNSVGSIRFEFENIKPLMNEENLNNVYTEEDVVATKLIIATKANADGIKALDDKNLFSSQVKALNREIQTQLQDEMISSLRDNADIVTYPSML